ncbi:MAG: hypothetical protein LUC38_03805 [Oscillospiraceae bacterium]|nr:hypothetical protein [Ruminococcus sp.]MCD8345069.1 hypothetical protein [Oscillospiraceae bacterium]
MKQDKKYEAPRMEIVLFDECAWTDVVTSYNTGVDTRTSAKASLLSMYDPDNWYGDQ